MDAWINVAFLTIALGAAVKLLHVQLSSSPSKAHAGAKAAQLPPGPRPLPVIGNLLLFSEAYLDVSRFLGRLRSVYGPVVTLYIGSQPAVYVLDQELAHEALVGRATEFAHRPPPGGASRVYSSDGHTISSADYGAVWRVLRRNLTAGVLNPSRVKSYAWARGRAIDVLMAELTWRAESGDGVFVAADALRSAVWRLLILMCFGDTITEEMIKDIEGVQMDLLHRAWSLVVFDMWPKAAKVFLRRRWNRFLSVRRRQEDVMLPLIKSHREKHKSQLPDNGEASSSSYLEGTFDLQLPEGGGRPLNDVEIVSLCSEFLNAGTDTTLTTMEWILANLVKHQGVQQRLRAEIAEAAGNKARIEEDDLERMPYLKAVILETLRRHPPAPFLLPHMTAEDTTFAGWLIPKGAYVNFSVAEMGRDESRWEEPMEFRPERFLAGGEGEGVDVTGSKEIKMMPFGAGRRVCPGLALGMLHLEYFVANLVRAFEWKAAVDGEEVDLSEKLEFTVVMKNPLRVGIVPLQH